jgi:hypothetical protein
MKEKLEKFGNFGRKSKSHEINRKYLKTEGRFSKLCRKSTKSHAIDRKIRSKNDDLKVLDLEFEGQVKGKRNTLRTFLRYSSWLGRNSHTLMHLTGQKKRIKAKTNTQNKRELKQERKTKHQKGKKTHFTQSLPRKLAARSS